MELSLKHIPCPAGNKCTAFHCIFGHEQDQPKPSPAAPEPPKPSPQQHDAQQAAANQDAPRKRLKPDPFRPSLSAPATRAKAPQINDAAKDSELRSIKQPVSPPPLKRKLPSTAKAQASPPTNRKPESATPKKTESLNPRLLKSAPASHEIRLKLVKLLHQEFVHLNAELKKTAKDDDDKALLLTEQDLITRTLDEEQEVAITKAAVYSNVMKNKVMAHKKMNAAQWRAQRAEERKKKQQQQKGPREEIKEIITGLTPAQEVEVAQRLTTPIDKLAQYGYVPKPPTDEDIAKAKEGVEAAKGWEKCDRCTQRFQVFPGRREEDGALTSGGSCTFHWGKSYIPAKQPGDRSKPPRRYICCGQEVGDSAGCHTQSHHVFKTTDPKRLAAVLQFAETPENPSAPTNRAVAFDCEMGYTVFGLELVRLTATSWPTGEELLDVLVRPLGEILDLNSRYSGVWPEDLAQAKPWTPDEKDAPTPTKNNKENIPSEETPKKKLKIVSSPEVARDLLFSLISPSTPLIGHGLENDLNAVRIVHPTLIDTVLLYPHKVGLPYRNGLKMLMDLHLGRKIQQETGPKVLGHDSAEDARAAGELVRLRVRNEWKDLLRVGWKVVNDEIMPPEVW